MTNKELLFQKIKDKGMKRSFVAERLGLSYPGFLNKVNDKTEFTSSEIQTLCITLSITDLEEKEKIFFAG